MDLLIRYHDRRLAEGVASQLTLCCQLNNPTPLVQHLSISNQDPPDPIAWRGGGGCCLQPLQTRSTVVLMLTFAVCSSK